MLPCPGRTVQTEAGEATPAFQEMVTYLVALVSLIGGAPRRVREDVRLGVLTAPELFLCLLQQLGGFHHVLLILVFIKPRSHQTCEVPVLVP